MYFFNYFFLCVLTDAAHDAFSPEEPRKLTDNTLMYSVSLFTMKPVGYALPTLRRTYRALSNTMAC